MSRVIEIEFIESRWRNFSEDPPRSGEVFVGRNGDKVYASLFMAKGRNDIVYLADETTHIGQTYDFFTHWMWVGNVKLQLVGQSSNGDPNGS